jgi:hypothetical protein
MKKIIPTLLATSLGLGIAVSTPGISSAAEIKTASASTVSSGSIDLNNIDELVKSGAATFKEVTYEEMIGKISDSDGITKEQARSLHPNQLGIKNGSRTNSLTAAASSTSLHELLIRQNVTSTYQPAVQIFVYTTGSGSFYQFGAIEQVGLNRKDVDSSTSKQFSGTVKATKQSLTTIWWFIDGDFFNNGTTSGTFTGGASAGIWSAEASITTETNHYKYWNKSGVYSIY